MKAILNRARISPKKVNLVAGMVRRKPVPEALHILSFLPKKAARFLYKVIHSATANAENSYAQERKKLLVQKILVSPAPSYKRWIPISRGRAHPLVKRNSYIAVELGLIDPDGKSSPSPKPKVMASVSKPLPKTSKKTSSKPAPSSSQKSSSSRKKVPAQVDKAVKPSRALPDDNVSPRTSPKRTSK